MLAKQALRSALNDVLSDMNLPLPEKLVISEPKNPEQGDLSINAAMLLAKKAGMPPQRLAEKICGQLMERLPEIERAEAAGPGFCNIFLKPEAWRGVISQIEREGAAYGRSDAGKGKKALVEYVSANPTGPLHVGHGRGAALGDTICRLLRACGYEADAEYYLNDAGRQMRTLGLSIWLRLKELAGSPVDFPADCYQGKYIISLAEELLKKRPDAAKLPDEEGIRLCQDFGMGEILEGIKKDLSDFGCADQNYFSEKSLIEGGSVEKALQSLEKSGRSFERDGALWFASGDDSGDKDRVLRKSDGSLTYFASDAAYHKNKYDRGYDWLINVWGADHHGYIPRIKGAVDAMGLDSGKLSVLLVQMVSLIQNGVPIPMSTRAGKFETLADVIDETGADAARFTFLSRSSDSPLAFDLDLARQRTMDNPVYYAQYAHARVQALLRRASDRGISLGGLTPPKALSALDSAEDIALLRKLAAFDEAVALAAQNLAPRILSAYLTDLAGKVHAYYAKYPVLGAGEGVREARMALLRAAGRVLANGLALLGVSAPDVM